MSDRPDAGLIQVEVIRAWPRRFESVTLRLAEGATLGDALLASGFPLADITGYSVFGERAQVDCRLCDGDRVELLRPLQVDPMDARRHRAAARGPSK